MSASIVTVCLKEMLENARDRRTLLTAFLFGPLFGPLFFAVLVNITVLQSIASVEESIDIPIIGSGHVGNLQSFLASQKIIVSDQHGLSDFADATDAVRRGDYDVVMLVEEGFAEDLAAQRGARIAVIYDQSNSRTNAELNRVRAALGAYSERVGALRLIARGMSPTVVRPFVVDEFDISTAAGRSVLLLGMLTYFLLLSTLMGGFYLAIDTTAGERERRSLEPLLATPVKRSSLLLGKLSATVAYMLASLGLTLLSFTLALEFLPLERLGMSSAFGAMSALAAFAVLLPFVPLGAAIMTVVASFTKSYKEAQGYLTIVLLVPTLPLIFASILNVRPSLALMAVPSLGQHLLISTLIRGETVPIPMYFVSSFASLLCAGLLILWADRLYKREGILG
jgi:sodium transport system permease protein